MEKRIKMSVKKELLKILEKNREKDLSGQELADRLMVSRTAIWKAMKELREEGYRIEAVNNRGYRLAGETDILSEEGIRLELTNNAVKEVAVFRTIDSTNLEVKRRALQGEKEGLVVISESQTAGRGRLGRSFYSPLGTGIYFSILLEPKLNATDAILLTTAASVAVARGIRRVTDLEPSIKWVNDVYLGDKKVCGILTEAMTDFETSTIQYIILGIGINYKEPPEGFPEEVKDIAGALVDGKEKIPRNRLVAAVLDEFFAIYKELPDRHFMDDYRRWSNVLNQDVKYLEKDIWHFAKAVGIDDDGGLIVRDKDGKEKILKTGEITLRRME